MADDYVQTLAQLMAISRNANTPRVNDPQAGQLTFPQGSTNQGYGTMGEQFGKGIGDYIKDTFVETQKKKYLQENDPIEIQKRAEKSFEIYQRLSPAEQTKMDNWLNNTAEGLRYLKQMQIAAPHLLTKVKKEYGEAGPPPGVTADDTDIVRFIRTTPSESLQKEQALMGMAPTDRQKMLFAKEDMERSSIPVHEAQAKAIPIEAEATKSHAESARINAIVNQNESPSRIFHNTALGRAALISANNARLRASGPNPEMVKWKRDLLKYNTSLELSAEKDFKDAYTKLSTSPVGSINKNKDLANLAVNRADQLKANIPHSMIAAGMYITGLNSILADAGKSREIKKGKAVVKNMDEYNRQAAMGQEVLSRWSRSIGSIRELNMYKQACLDLWSKYPQYFYPGAKASDYVSPGGKALSPIQRQMVKDVNTYDSMFNTILKEEQARKSEEKSLLLGE